MSTAPSGKVYTSVQTVWTIIVIGALLVGLVFLIIGLSHTDKSPSSSGYKGALNVCLQSDASSAQAMTDCMANEGYTYVP